MKKTTTLICLLLFVYAALGQTKITTYTGNIKGYSINMGFKTAQLHVKNVVTGLSDMYLIDIQPDGKFSASFPLLRSQECMVTFPFFYDYVYFEPGKNLIQDFDIAEIPKVFSVFKGESKLALINNDMNKVRPILKYDDLDTKYADIYQLSPEQYKAYILRGRDLKIGKIDSVVKTSGMNKVSYDLARKNVEYWTGYELIQYNYMLDVAYHLKNKLSFNTKKPALAPVHLDIGYYDFLKGMKYDRAAMASWNYAIFMNMLMIIDPIMDKAGRKDYTEEIKKLKALDKLDKSDSATLEYYEEAAWRNPTVPGMLEKARPVVLRQLLKNDISLGLELMYLQSVAQRMDDLKDTLSANDLAEVKSKIKNKFLLTDIELLNKKIKESISKAKTQTGYTNNQLPANAPAEGFFKDLIDKYKGKAVFIDFWATWCAPCMVSIQEMAPLKEELAKDKDIVFLYITNPTSPAKAYQTVIPGIKGEHYRVTQDQYNLLAKQFQVTGIPHYALVNKRGEVVDANFKWSQTTEIKKRLLTLANE